MIDYASERGQIPLSIGLKEKPGFDLFIPGENNEAVITIKRIIDNKEPTQVYVWGKTGTGKTHLLHAACASADEQSQRTAYVPLSDYADIDPDILQDLDSMDLVCIDDIDQIAGQPEWEQAFFHFYNRLRDSQHSLLMTGSTGPEAIAINLPDLKSRIGWGLVFRLTSVSDDDKIKALQKRANARAFDLPDDVADYLVRRVDRNLTSLIQLLDRFDVATLAEKRKLTIPFVKKLLNHY